MSKKTFEVNSLLCCASLFITPKQVENIEKNPYSITLFSYKAVVTELIPTSPVMWPAISYLSNTISSKKGETTKI